MADQQKINNQRELNQAIQDGTITAESFLNVFDQLNEVQQEGVRIAVARTAEARDLSSILKDQLGIVDKRTDSETALLGIVKQINSAAEENVRLIQSVNEAEKARDNRIKTLSSSARELALAQAQASEQDVIASQQIFEAKQKVNDALMLQEKFQKKLDESITNQVAAEAQLKALKEDDTASAEAVAAAEALVKAAQDESKLLQERITRTNQLVASADAGLDFALQGTSEAAQQLAIAQEAGRQAAENVKIAEGQVEVQNRVKNSLGLVGNTLKGLKGFFGEGLLAGFKLDQVQKDMEKFSQDAKGNVSRFQVLGVGLKSAFSNLGGFLKDPAVIFGSIFKGFMDFEKANREVRQLTGQSADNISSANMSLMSATDQAKTIGSLSKEIGINVNAAFGSDTIIAASELTNLLGVSEKSAANLALRAEAFGGSLKGADETVFNTVQGFNMQNRSAVNVGAVLEDVGSASNSLALSLGGSTEELTKAAAGAARLGINLEQAEGIADQLLNFEQSIQNELEAELLTGKQINLEGARQAALNNDIAALTKEIGDNQEILSAFSSGNRIQQDAIAKSLGMSKDEVAKMIFLRQKENNLTDEQAAKAAGLNIETAKRLGAQESINKSIEKLTTAFAPIFSKFADLIAIITNNSAGLVATYSVLALAIFPKLASAAGGFLSNITKSVTAARGLVSNFMDAGKEGAGFFGRIRAAFTGTADKVEAASEVKDAASDVSDVAGKVGDSSEQLGGINSKNIRKFFQDLAAGLRSMGSAKVLAGIGNTILFAPAAVLMVASIPFLSFIGLVKLPFLKSNFKGLGQGLTSLATALPGVAALALFGPAAALASLSLPFLIAMAIPGFGTLIGTGLGGLATGLTALGTAASTGLPFLAVGLIASIGAAMIPFAFSLQLITPLVETFGNIFIGVFTALPPIISALASLADPSVALGLLTIAPGLIALNFGLISLSMGLTAFALSTGLLTAITGNSNPFGMFEQLAEYAPGIDMAASALTKMTAALVELQSALDSIDSEKLNDVMSPSLGGVVLGLGTSAIQGVTDTVNSIAGILGGDEEGGKDNAVVTELQAVKEVLNQILEKEGNVVIDTSRAGTAFAMGTSRLQ